MYGTYLVIRHFSIEHIFGRAVTVGVGQILKYYRSVLLSIWIESIVAVGILLSTALSLIHELKVTIVVTVTMIQGSYGIAIVKLLMEKD